MSKSIKKNAILNMTLTLANVIFPLLTFPYVSRVLHPEGIGEVSYATSVVSYFLLLSQLGLPLYGVRILSQHRKNRFELTKTLKELFILNLVLALFVYFILCLSIMLIPSFRVSSKIFYLMSLNVIFPVFGVEWFYQAIEDYSYITKRSLAVKLISTLFIFIFIHSEKDILLYTLILVLGSGGAYILNFINLKNHIDSFRTVPFKTLEFKKHFKPLLILFLASAATSVYASLDSVLLGMMKGSFAVGIFSTSVKIKTLVVSIITSIGAVLLPRISLYESEGKKEEILQLQSVLFNITISISIPITLFLFVFSKESILFLAGSEYTDSILPMQIMMPTVFFITLSVFMANQILIPRNQDSVVLRANSLGVIVSLVLCTLSIYLFSFNGAAITNLLAEISIFSSMFYVLRSTMTIIVKKSQILYVLIASLLSVIIVSTIKLLTLSSLLTLLLSGSFFVILYILFTLLLRVQLVIDAMHMLMDRLKNKLH